MAASAAQRITGINRSSGRSRFALVGLATILAATILNSVVYFVGKVFVDYDRDFVILQNVAPTIMFTVVPAIIGVLLYALLPRFTQRPERTFEILAAVVLVASIIPDLTYIPGVEGASNGQTAILVVMHLVAAAAIVGTLISLAPRAGGR